jgi:hypothetical protein
VKIRLEGTKQEIEWLAESLAKTYSITKLVKLYPNRDGKTHRAYVELVAFFVTSSSTADSQEPKPKSGDMVLGG